MKERLANLDEVMKTLRGFLPQYLEEQEIDITANFSCLSPAHEDDTPSMTCGQNPENAYCFTCGVTMDIFQAANWIEGKPSDGPGFVSENVAYLAEKYGVEIELEEMTEEESYRFRTYRAYADAAKLISNPHFGDYTKMDEEAKKRGWKPGTLESISVGTVNYKDFRETLKKAMGYEARFLDEIDLGRADIFNEDNMVFTISDEWGRPVGFAARNLTYDGKHGTKYRNQKTTGLKCNIYQKGKRLYAVHTAKQHTPPLYIFEGYTDVITAQQAGLKNCVAIGGTAVTDDHVALIKRLNMYDIVLALDGDKAGHEKSQKLLDEKFSGEKDLRVSVINIPDEMDPDEFIRSKGLDEFLKLRKWSAFEWRLHLYNDDDDPHAICNIMIPLVVNEASHIEQDKMCRELSLFTGVDLDAISQELERLQNVNARHRRKEKEQLISRTVEEAQRNPDDAKAIFRECAVQIEELEEEYNENALSQKGWISFIENQKTAEENTTDNFAGFQLSGLGLGELGAKLNSGNWREDVFMCFGGVANSGKTSLCCQLAHEIASHEENNACVIYHTIDDSSPQLLPRFVVQAYGNTDLTINHVRNPFFCIEETGDKFIWERRQQGYEKLLQLVRDGRLILKDVNDGASFGFGESLIKHYQKKFPDRQIVYILDNLHKTPDYQNMDVRIRFKTLSNQMKNTATKYHVPVISTVEYTKMMPGTIPNNNNIAETRAIIYDASFIGHLYNDLHDAGEEKAWLVHEKNGDLLPRIRLGIGKNKITDFKGRVFLDFHPGSGIFKWVSVETAEADQQARRKILQANGSYAHNFKPHDSE